MAIESVIKQNMAYQGSVSSSGTAERSASDGKRQMENIQIGEHTAEQAVSDSSKNDSTEQDQSVQGNEAPELLTGTEAMKKAVEQINKNARNSEAIFGIHEKTNRITIKIIDKDTKKVLREYPPEKTLDMIAKVWEMAGLMVDEKR